MASTIRNKTAMLEMKSDGMFKRDRWKPCYVKVSSSIYLLYFKGTDDMSRPDGTVLLNNITKVEAHSAKDSNFAFEVHFRHTKTSPGSPWVFNTTSPEDRIDWMEVIRPGSAHIMKQMLHSRNTLSPTSKVAPEVFPPVPQVSSKPQPNPRKRSDPHIQSMTLPASVVPKPVKSSPPAPLTSSVEIPSTLPQDYVEPSSFPNRTPPLVPNRTSPLDPTVSLPVGMLNANGHTPPPLARRPNHTYSHKPRDHPKQISKSSSENSFPPDLGHYEVMDPTVVEEVPQPVAASRSSKPKPKPRSRVSQQPPPTVTRPPQSPSSPTDDILEEDDDGGYLCLVADKKPNNKTPTPSESRNASVSSDVAEQLMKSFDKDQLGSLIHMLQKVQGQGQQGMERSDSPDQGPETSLRGSFKRMLSHAPDLSSEKMLVNEEDDSDESYEPRPEWAKAVPQQMARDSADEGQFDTLTALQEDALTIYREDLDDLEKIGEGQFGQVFRGTLNRGMELVEVAVKTTKKSTEEATQQAFLKEMKVMSQLLHPNIVRLYGLVQKDVPAPWIVLEYLRNGDLKSFLTKNKRPLPKLVKYMVDVSMGMHYLSEKGLVHRDLAARNVLVTDNETCKVADFGLLRELPKDESFYHMQTNVPCPVRWMPPESITERNFSTASDVWSFGILIWEMFNPTKNPYTSFSNIEVATKVMKGFRLPVPRNCPPVIARIMKACWQDNPKKRPSFLLVSTLLTTKVSFPPEPTE